MIVEIGPQYPLHSGASSRSILAFLPQDYIDDAVRDLRAAKPDVDVDDFLAKLAEVREFGHATSSNERGTGAASIAAPFFDADGHVLGSVSSSGPASRYSADVDERHQTHARQVVAAAETITGLLRPGGAQ